MIFKFDNNLLNSIRQAKYFLLVLTPNALDRCIKDDELKDWVHRVIIFRFMKSENLKFYCLCVGDCTSFTNQM